MTKRNFIAIARIISYRSGYDYSTIQFDAGYNKAVEDLAGDLADYFAVENPNFNREVFLTACGVQ